MESKATDPASLEAQQAAWYQYYQQNPEAQAQYMAQWQQYQAQAAQYYYGAMGAPTAQPVGGYPSAGRGPSSGGYPGYSGGSQDSGYPQRRERPVPSTTLWVGNLTPDTREEDLRRAFEPYGPIESVRIHEGKNFGFVVFSNLESAQAAHRGTYGMKINGAEVKINWGRNPTGGQQSSNRPSGGPGYPPYGYQGGAPYGGGAPGGYSGYGGPQSGQGYGGAPGGGYPGGYGSRPPRGPRTDDEPPNAPSPNIWVGNVDPNAPEHEIKAIFDRFGPIERVKLLPSRNCAFINFVELSSAQSAKNEMNGFMFYGQHLKVNFGKQKESTGGIPRPVNPQQASGGWYPPTQYPSGSTSMPSAAQTSTKPSLDVPIESIPTSEPQGVPEEMKTMISRLVEAFSRNPDLEAQTKINQADSPKFSFLFPGKEGYDYFLWKKYGATLNSSNAASNSTEASAPAQQASQTFSGDSALSANDIEEINGILSNLDSSKDKIGGAGAWVQEHASKAAHCASILYDFALNKLTSSQSTVAFIYLVNEVFNVTLRAKSAGEMNEAVLSLPQTFLPGLSNLLKKAYNEDQKDLVPALINRWRGESVMSETDLDDLEAAVLGSDSKKRKRPDSENHSENEGEEEPSSKRRDLGEDK